MVKTYRKKPVVVEAIQLDDNYEEIFDWSKGEVRRHIAYQHNERIETIYMEVHTLEGLMLVSPKDYVIKGVEGEFYPCKPNIFEKTYQIE